MLAPSQDLVAQTAREWDRGRPDEKHIAVCALPPNGRDALCIPFTTSPAEFARRVAAHSGPTIVFSTYQSLPAIAEAHRRHGLPEWAIAVADEAHHTSGSLDKSWGDIHHDARIPAQRRLYMTATPRRWSHPKSKKHGAYTEPLASMDNPALFGPVVFRLELAEAIAQGILADYRVVVPVIGAQTCTTSSPRPRRPPHLDGLRLAAMQVGLLRAVQEYCLGRVLTFRRPDRGRPHRRPHPAPHRHRLRPRFPADEAVDRRRRQPPTPQRTQRPTRTLRASLPAALHRPRARTDPHPEYRTCCSPRAWRPGHSTNARTRRRPDSGSPTNAATGGGRRTCACSRRTIRPAPATCSFANDSSWPTSAWTPTA
ncbi:DEAD/DEAH box helicase family protein [Streptomyces sp. SID3343]|nr:DEAD/DEAH box helicase family protein [Streptomyces sp. SID3343]